MMRSALVLCLILSTASCGGDPEMKRAEKLAQSVLIVDAHVDLPYRLKAEMEDVTRRTASGDFDYPRAVEGGLNLPFMSIYVPAEYQETGGAAEVADELIDMVEKIAADAPDKFSMVTGVEQARGLLEQDGMVGFALGMENGAPIEDFDKLKHFHDRGVRYITLTHSENNHISDSSYADEREWNGLSPFGVELLWEMNKIGMMIDVSHISDEAFEQVIEHSRAPVVATHSSCRHFTPEFERNMSDEMIKKLGAQGGVIHINFGSAFLTDEARRQSSAYWKARGEFIEHNGFEGDAPEVEEFGKSYWEENQRAYADVKDVADHIDHVVQLVGVAHVGLGSDFDGVGDSLPTGLKDVSYYPNLIRELLDRGYTEEQIAKMCGGNLLRLWAEVERWAAMMQKAAEK
ncbi:MAG: membrane dipeptidase [bacterium]|nr:membrane dipeptidase [bacterium]